ncbi:hypothetical protein [uncultured Deinococcus sp.]|uniref:hypothetical protein n=1 Tax=uncultured Deinococcus sp. TaxID=158789 RepID=UPI0037478CC2
MKTRIKPPTLLVPTLLSLLPLILLPSARADTAPCTATASITCAAPGPQKIVIPACYCDAGRIVTLPPVLVTPVVRAP